MSGKRELPEDKSEEEPPCKRPAPGHPPVACLICNNELEDPDEIVECRRKTCIGVTCRGCALHEITRRACPFCGKGCSWRVFRCSGAALAEWLLDKMACPKCLIWCVRGAFLMHRVRGTGCKEWSIIDQLAELWRETRDLSEDYRRARRPEDADALQEAMSEKQALAVMRVRHLNAKHLASVAAVRDLIERTSYDDAMAVMWEDLPSWGSPASLAAMYALGVDLDMVGRYADAVRVFRANLQLKQRILGKEHESTLSTMHTLASVLDKAGEHADAVQLSRECLALRQRVLGKEHEDTLFTMHFLAVLLAGNNERAEAGRLFRELLDVVERNPGAAPVDIETIRQDASE